MKWNKKIKNLILRVFNNKKAMAEIFLDKLDEFINSNEYVNSSTETSNGEYYSSFKVEFEYSPTKLDLVFSFDDQSNKIDSKVDSNYSMMGMDTKLFKYLGLVSDDVERIYLAYLRRIGKFPI